MPWPKVTQPKGVVAGSPRLRQCCPSSEIRTAPQSPTATYRPLPWAMQWMELALTVNPSVNANSIHCIAHGNGRYVAVGDWGAVLISEDGQHWRNRGLPATTPFGWVTFGHGIFVAYAATHHPRHPV